MIIIGFYIIPYPTVHWLFDAGSEDDDGICMYA
jgi:hypothetical protein